MYIQYYVYIIYNIIYIIYYYYYLQDYSYTSNSAYIAKLRDHQVVSYPLGKRCYYHEFIQSLWASPDSNF